MGRVKVFLLSFIVTLAVIVPIYGIGYFLTVEQNNAEFASEQQSGIYIAQPIISDEKTVLLMVGEGNAQNAESYTIISFNAYENSISIASMPPQTVMVLNQSPITLSDATRSAGPSQAAKAISETLGIQVDNYVFVSQQVLWETAEAFGTISMRLNNFLDSDDMNKMGLDEIISDMYTLTPRLFSQILSECTFDEADEYEMRAQGYSLYLSAGHGNIKVIFANLLTKNSSQIATNISALDIVDYERIWGFLDRQQPSYNAGALPGYYSRYGDKVYELNEGSMAFIEENF